MAPFLSRHYQSNNTQIRALMNSLPIIAQTGANILIQGESGTGKELIAKHIHHLAHQGDGNFFAVNCAAVPEALLESEFFGHRKGAFTGAVTDKKGIFESANGGTVFLDEIGDMPLNLQAKLLRVLQEKTIRPLGTSTEKKINFKLISATHRNLQQEVQKGNFREDLYYRINVIPLTLPPLRERKEDIPILIKQFSERFSIKYTLPLPDFSEAVLEKLTSQKWRGNIRELENFIERTIILNAQKSSLELADLPVCEEQPWEDADQIPSFSNLPSLEKLIDDYIRYVLSKVNLHQGKAAEILGVSRRTISRKLQKGIS